MKRTLNTLLTVILVISWLFTGCAPQTTAQPTEVNTLEPVASEQPVNTTVVVLSWMGSESLDPTAGLLTDNFVQTNLYDTLVRFNPDYTMAPSLAESWVETAEGITFNLRQDVTFHDGSQFTADDVVFSLERAMSQPRFGFWHNVISSIEKVDEYTVRIGKVKPYIKLLETLATNSAIVPKALVEADPAAFAENPVGTGAFKYVSTGTDGSITLEANEDYFLGAPEVKTLVILMPMDPATALVAMQQGEIDVMQGVSPTFFSQIEQSPNLSLVAEQGWTTIQMTLCGEPFASNDKLREAVYHAINPENILALGAGGGGVVPDDYFTPKMMGSLAGYLDISDRYDPALAQQLLTDSGYDTSVPIVIDASPITANVLTVVQADLAAIGLNIQLNQVDMNTYWDHMFKGELVAYVGYKGGVQQPLEELLTEFSTEGDRTSTGGKKDPAYDALLAQLTVEQDAAAREVIMKDALDNLASRYIIVPMYHPYLAVAINSRIQNFANVAVNMYYVIDWDLSE